LRVVQCRRRNPLLAVVKNVDVTGDARRVPIQRRGPGRIAFRVAVYVEQEKMWVCILDSGTAGPLDLFYQPPGFTVALDAQGARGDKSIRRGQCLELALVP
jgi:hypothetical protein